MTDRRPDVFEMPADTETARLISLFRAIVGCPAAQGHSCFGESGPVGGLVSYLREVDFGARRRLMLGAGDRATADELALAHLIVEAQGGDMSACGARAAWLVRRGRVASLVAAAMTAADALAFAGVAFAPISAPARAATERRPADGDGDAAPARQQGQAATIRPR